MTQKLGAAVRSHRRQQAEAATPNTPTPEAPSPDSDTTDFSAAYLALTQAAVEWCQATYELDQPPEAVAVEIEGSDVADGKLWATVTCRIAGDRDPILVHVEAHFPVSQSKPSTRRGEEPPAPAQRLTRGGGTLSLKAARQSLGWGGLGISGLSRRK